MTLDKAAVQMSHVKLTERTSVCCGTLCQGKDYTCDSKRFIVKSKSYLNGLHDKRVYSIMCKLN